jgi:hypothetical protein
VLTDRDGRRVRGGDGADLVSPAGAGGNRSSGFFKPLPADAADGSFVAVRGAADDSTNDVLVVGNWFEELRRRWRADAP